MSDFNLFLPLSKVTATKDGGCIVSGYASTQALDLDGEIIAIDAVRKALPGYWQWRNVREMHQPSAVGVGKEAHIDEKGLFLTAKITDKVAAQKCIDGVYKGYSVGGKKLSKTGNMITEIDLIEISVVDRPANPECKIEVAKAAKPNSEAHLMKLGKPNSKLTKALASMAKVAEFLTIPEEEIEKVGPPAARDGFSLPAGPIAAKSTGGLMCKMHKVAGCSKCTCAKHAMVDCEKCAAKATKKFAKRKFTTDQRSEAASHGAANPDGSFPIENRKDLKNAIKLRGHGDPERNRKLIIRRAHELEAEDLLPADWKAALAKKLAKKQHRTAAGAALSKYVTREFPDLAGTGSAAPPFLTLKADSGSRVVAEGKAGGRRSPDPSAQPQKGDLISLSKRQRKQLLLEDDMAGNSTLTGDALGNFILETVKAARAPTRAQHMAAGMANMKKARKARGMARDMIADIHKMHKAAYLSKMHKAAGKKPEKDEDGDFDHEGAMEKLQKAYNALDTAKVFDKAAKEHLAKAASGVSRAGQRGQEAADPEAEFYEVPMGVKDLDPNHMATLSPGGHESGSFPPELMLDGPPVTPNTGKAAKKGAMDLSRYITKDMAELMAKNAALETENKLLARMPAGGGPRPHAFDVKKVIGKAAAMHADGTAGNILSNPEVWKGVNMQAVGTKDEEGRPTAEHTSAVGKALGQAILGGNIGKSVFSSDFHGVGALGAVN